MAKKQGKKALYSNGAVTMRTILGILSILLSFIVGLQSCVAGVGEAIADTDTSSGAAGMFLGFFMLAAGVIAIATRKSKGGTITALIFYAIGGVLALANSSENFGDLIIWTVLAFVFAGLLFISLFMKNKDSDEQEDDE